MRSLLESGYAVATFSRASSPAVNQFQVDFGNRFRHEGLDIRDHQAVRRFVLSVRADFGRIDVLINNTGVLVEGVCGMTPVSDIQHGLAVNLEGPLHLTHVCGQVMLRQRSATIVNVSSINAIRGFAGLSVYSAAKAGLEASTRSLARELGPRGIRINSVTPGYFESEMTAGISADDRERIRMRTPLRRLGTEDDVLKVIRFLVSDESSFVTGQTLVCDGGLTC